MQVEKLLVMGASPRGPDIERILGGGSGSTVPGSQKIGWEDVRMAIGLIQPAAVNGRTASGDALRAALQLKAIPSQVSGMELAEMVYALGVMLIDQERRLFPTIRAKDDDKANASLRRSIDKRRAAIIRVALAEYQQPNVCRHCHGGGQTLAPRKRDDGTEPVLWGRCDNCHGLGYVRWSQNSRASAIGGDRNAYAETIDPFYEHVLCCCRDLYLEAVRQFKSRLFG
ncbi:MAG: hypothetical protein RLZZ300_2595 [Pseudomonadota bacterium]|jgi:hypothetical protein